MQEQFFVVANLLYKTECMNERIECLLIPKIEAMSRADYNIPCSRDELIPYAKISYLNGYAITMLMNIDIVIA